MGKTRDLFKKIRDTKGTFYAKMCLIKDRNGVDLTEAEDMKKRWQEYTGELYKKDLHDPDNDNGGKSLVVQTQPGAFARYDELGAHKMRVNYSLFASVVYICVRILSINF